MPEPLLGHLALVADCDPVAQLATVQSQPVGSAGSAGLDLGAGVEVDIDVADPGTVVGLTIELPSGGEMGALPASVRRRLSALLGADRSAELCALVGDAADGQVYLRRALGTDDTRQGNPVGRVDDGELRRYLDRWSAGGEITDRRDQPSAPLSASNRDVLTFGVDPDLHRGTLAQAAAYQPGAPQLVRAVGLLEAAASLGHVAELVDLRRAARHHARVGTELMLDLLAGDLVAVPDHHTAAGLASVVRRATGLLDDQPVAAARMVALADELDRGDYTAASPVVTSGVGQPSPAQPQALATGLGRRVPVDVSGLPGALAEAALAGRRTGPSEVELRIDGWAGRHHGLWARAFDATDDTLLALAPFRGDGHDAVAYLLVAPDAMRQIEVDVTDRPEMPRPSPALALVQRAIHLGALAAQAERLTDVRLAAHRWRQCARNWLAAGDSVRADQARTYAGQADSSEDIARHDRIIRPLVTDLINRVAVPS
jgi:hypothetical protein